MYNDEYKVVLEKLKTKIRNYVIVIFLVLTLISGYALYSIIFEKFASYEKNLVQNIELNVNSSIDKLATKYKLTLERILSNKNVMQNFIKQNRQKLYKSLEEEWSYIIKDNPNVEIINFHSSDGKVFLRMNNLNLHSYDVSLTRPMIKKVHTEHIQYHLYKGFETGPYDFAYRLVMPIYNEKNNYIGAIEMGISPQYILNEIKKSFGAKGFFLTTKEDIKKFIYAYDLDLSNFVIPEIFNIQDIIKIKYLPENYDFQTPTKITVNEVTYFYATVDLLDYKKDSVSKFLFYKDITSFVSEQIKFGLTVSIVFFIIGLLGILFSKFFINRFADILNKFFSKRIELEMDEKNYLKAIENSSENFIITITSEKIISLNKPALNFFNLQSLEKFRQKYESLGSLFHKEEGYLERYVDGVLWIEYVTNNRYKTHKVKFIKNHEEYIFLVTGQKLDYRDKNIYIATFSDITNLEKLNKDYQYIIKRNQFAEEGSNLGLWDWDLIQNKIYYSPKWKNMLGYEDDELENNFAVWNTLINPEDKEKTSFDIKENQNGKTKFYENIHRLKHKNGNWVWILARGQTIYDEKGKAVRMLGFHTDITDIKKLEEKLFIEIKKSHELNIMVENSINEIYIFNKENFKFSYTNKSAMKNNGFSFDEMLDKTPVDLSPHFTYEYFSQILEPLANHEVDYIQFSSIRKRKDTTTYQADVYIQLLEHEESISYVSILVDTTEREKMIKNIREQEEMMMVQSKQAAMGEMISMIAHQWRQPIASVAMGVNNILLDVEIGTSNDDDLKIECEGILEQTKYLSETIDDFRNFFKNDKEKTLVSVEEVINNAINLMENSLKSVNITLEKSFYETSKIETFPNEILQILLNLIKNAKEILTEKEIENKFIRIYSTQDDNYIYIDVEDNGGGIPNNILDRIFEAYFTTKEELNGTGLGLYMSKKVSNEHLKGDLTVRNSINGAIFTISIKK